MEKKLIFLFDKSKLVEFNFFRLKNPLLSYF